MLLRSSHILIIFCRINDSNKTQLKSTIKNLKGITFEFSIKKLKYSVFSRNTENKYLKIFYHLTFRGKNLENEKNRRLSK